MNLNGSITKGTEIFVLTQKNATYNIKWNTKFIKYFPLSLFQAIQHLIQRHAVTEPPSKSHTNNNQPPRTKTTSTIISNSSSTENQFHKNNEIANIHQMKNPKTTIENA